MDILTLRYFACICQNKSIAKSADSFFISRQALSKSMINLEKELGVQLLIRNHSGINITPAGQRLWDSAQGILQIWDTTQEDLKKIQHQSLQIIRAGYGQISFTLWKSDHVCQFSLLHPEISVHTEIALPDELHTALLEGRLDIAVTHSFCSDQFSRTLLATCPTCALMRADDPLAGGGSVRLSDLKNRTVILRPGQTEFSSALVQLLQSEQIPFETFQLFDAGIAIVLQAIREKQRIYFTSQSFQNVLGTASGTVSLPLVHDDMSLLPSRDIYAITLKDKKNAKAVSTYIRYLKASVRQPAVSSSPISIPEIPAWDRESPPT